MTAMKMRHCTFIFFLRVDFNAAEPVVREETTKALDGNRFPRQADRIGEFAKNPEVQRF